ncbi:MAG: DEAD/DEAH box helicase, partial [Mobilitalea sp.]
MLCKQRLLVVTPSKMVRGQITEDFAELRTLCITNVFKGSMKKPKVFELEHLFKEEFIPQLEEADVIVATPNCALSLSESEWAKEKIDLVEVDEAHHTPAKTWQQILINLNKASHILFTATPFRLDRKEISGEIIYNYPLSRAYEDGIFGEVQYIPVDDAKNKDICIAKKAEEILFNDREAGYEHYLMVRTDTKDNASALVDIYKDNTSLRLAKIDSSMVHSKIKKCLSDLREGNLDGIICVDMLGEGYDFPNLKIAAIHIPHKSLASTLQFIGRFARTNASNIGSAKFIALNDEELEIENNVLYSKDSIWQEMIIGMSEGKNKEEIESRSYYKEFSGENI